MQQIYVQHHTCPLQWNVGGFCIDVASLIARVHCPFTKLANPVAAFRAGSDLSCTSHRLLQSHRRGRCSRKWCSTQVPAALATSSPEARIKPALHLLGLENAFARVVTAEDVYRGRPDPEPYLLAAQQLGRPPARCVVIGNSNQVGRILYMLSVPEAPHALALAAVPMLFSSYMYMLCLFTECKIILQLAAVYWKLSFTL